MIDVATTALIRKRGHVLCIEKPLPVQPLVGQSRFLGHAHSAQSYEVLPVW